MLVGFELGLWRAGITGHGTGTYDPAKRDTIDGGGGHDLVIAGTGNDRGTDRTRSVERVT